MHTGARPRERFVSTKQRTRRSRVNYRHVTTMPKVNGGGGRGVYVGRLRKVPGHDGSVTLIIPLTCFGPKVGRTVLRTAVS